MRSIFHIAPIGKNNEGTTVISFILDKYIYNIGDTLYCLCYVSNGTQGEPTHVYKFTFML